MSISGGLLHLVPSRSVTSRTTRSLMWQTDRHVDNLSAAQHHVCFLSFYWNQDSEILKHQIIRESLGRLSSKCGKWIKRPPDDVENQIISVIVLWKIADIIVKNTHRCNPSPVSCVFTVNSNSPTPAEVYQEMIVRWPWSAKTQRQNKKPWTQIRNADVNVVVFSDLSLCCCVFRISVVFCTSGPQYQWLYWGHIHWASVSRSVRLYLCLFSLGRYHQSIR